MKEHIIKESGQEVLDLISDYVQLNQPNNLVLSTSTVFNIEYYPEKKCTSITNLRKLNDVRFINKFLEAVNSRLIDRGLFIGCIESMEQRKERIFKKYRPVIRQIYYYVLDFIVKRVFPKFSLTKGLYFFLTHGRNRVVSRAEILGRLYSCGFEVLDERNINNLFYVVARKIKEPAYDNDPTYGFLIRLKRIGKGGKLINVLKFRTMHPYSEYLQDYIFRKHHLQEGGKFHNDFRITTLGRFMRKFWLDELPMLINLLRGDCKLVGVRPLSPQYFNLYTPELRKQRIRYKPGLIPPFYADMPKTLEEIMASEQHYLDQYEKNPFMTDLKYLFRALYNIIFKVKRSA